MNRNLKMNRSRLLRGAAYRPEDIGMKPSKLTLAMLASKPVPVRVDDPKEKTE